MLLGVVLELDTVEAVVLVDVDVDELVTVDMVVDVADEIVLEVDGTLEADVDVRVLKLKLEPVLAVRRGCGRTLCVLKTVATCVLRSWCTSQLSSRTRC